VGELHLALERALHTADTDLHGRLVLVVAKRLELLAARDGLLEVGRIEEGVPDFLAGGGNVVRALELHTASLLFSRTFGRTGPNRTTGMSVAPPHPGSKKSPSRQPSPKEPRR